MTDEHYVGVMSGTSLDGVDAVLASFDNGQVHCHAKHTECYGDDLKREALALNIPGDNELHRAASLANKLASLYAKSVNGLLAKAGVDASAIQAIGCHGQTVRHEPTLGYTLQLNNAALLAELTGITVVADFRSRDIAAGGQGAPLVPAFHDTIFRAEESHRVILNIGGIANITDLKPGTPTIGFDCGPGNMLMDTWAQHHLGRPYDAGGNWARQGQVLPELLDRLLAHPFLALPPPKSCGREQFNLDWLQSRSSGDESPADVQATLAAFTATTISDAICRYCGNPAEIFVCGGGARNDALMALLGEQARGWRVTTTDFLGLPAEWVEAAAFAWLARCTLRGETGNLPAVTGARGPRILGAIYPA